MKTILVHSTFVGGHQLEYLHHLYMGALSIPGNHYVFVVPHKFFVDGVNMSWPKSENIEIVETAYEDRGGMLAKSYRMSRDLSLYAKAYHASEIILIELMGYLPFLPFVIDNRIKIKGIIYRIYLYDWKEESLKRRVLEVLKYQIFSRFKTFNKVFILNDLASSNCLNRLYHTSKFCYLPDPVSSQMLYSGKDIRDQLHISKEKSVFLHPGGMMPYKGTIEILKSISLLGEADLQKIAIIFAGRVTSNIEKEFEYYYNDLKNKVQLILIEGYLPFEELADLFVTCDYVLIPYKVKSQSSGIVGHAAYYHRPVIVAKGGVIGKTVKKWKLGFLLESPTKEQIAQFLIALPQWTDNDSGYVKYHSIEEFNKIIFEK